MKQPIVTRALLLNLLDDCIVNSLQAEPLLGYREIAKHYGCSTAYIVKIAALTCFMHERCRGGLLGTTLRRWC